MTIDWQAAVDGVLGASTLLLSVTHMIGRRNRQKLFDMRKEQDELKEDQRKKDEIQFKAYSTLTSDVTKLRAELQGELNAIVTQVQALALDIARNYITKTEASKMLEEISTRMYADINAVNAKLDRLTDYLLRFNGHDPNRR